MCRATAFTGLNWEIERRRMENQKLRKEDRNGGKIMNIPQACGDQFNGG